VTPCSKEQQKIADYLSILDSKLEKEKEKLENLNELKKGYMGYHQHFAENIR